MSLVNSSVLHIVRNSVDHDSRVLKETGSLLNFFPELEVLIAGFHEPDSRLIEDIGGRKLKRFSLSSRILPKNIMWQLFKYFEWHCRVVSYYSNSNIEIIHCHDLIPLGIAVHLKLITGARLIYDAHELETEANGLFGLRKAITRLVENFLLKYVDSIITVSPSIVAWYKRKFPHVPVTLVRNVPSRIGISQGPNISLRESYSLKEDDLLFVYLGGICNGRGVDVILKAFADASVRHHVLFIGSGPRLQEVMTASSLNSRIHYHKPVPPDAVISYINGADVGLCLIEDVCLSYRYCLPNKLFESVIAVLPVLGSNLPDQAKLVNKYKSGWLVKPDSNSVVNFLAQITSGDVAQMRAGLLERTSELSWENEQQKLIDVYTNLLRGIS